MTQDVFRLDGLRVLVVEDDDDMREAMTLALELYGASVSAAASASEALQTLERERPDVLLSDISMPGDDGYALIHKVRARPAHQGGRIPAGAVTARIRPEDRQRVLMAGFQIHVTKPVEPEALAAVVARLAGRTPASGRSRSATPF